MLYPNQIKKYIIVLAVILFALTKNDLKAQGADSEVVSNIGNSALDALEGSEITDAELEKLLSKSLNLSPQAKKKIDAAFSAMETVKKAGAYIESLQDLFKNGIVTLPVGIKKGDYELIIQQIELDEKTGMTKIYTSCAFKFKEDGQRIAFDGWVNLEGRKGLGNYGSLKIVAPIKRSLGDKATIIFNEGTKVNFGCEGIESFFANLCVAFTSKKIKPVDVTGKSSGKYLATQVQTSFSNFDQYTLSLSFDKHFMFEGAKDLIFTLKGATLDQSDAETSSMIKFPTNYFTGNNKEERALWKGISFAGASVSLPAIFKKPSQTTKKDTAKVVGVKNRIAIGVKNFIVDENGISGKVLGGNVLSVSDIDTTKWAITVSDFSCELLKNEVVGIGFGGDMNLPPLGKNSLLPYHASYNHSEKAYQFEVQVKGKYEFPVLKSSLNLNENSFIEVVIKDNDFYPSLHASGKLTIDAPIGKKDSKTKFKLPDISFQNMCISRESPYFSVGALGVTGKVSTPKIAGFQLSVDSIKPFQSEAGNGVAFRAGVKLSDVFGGSTGLKLYGDYSKWSFDKLSLERVNVNFKSEAYSVKGGLLFKEGDAIYGKGFRGEVKFKIINKFEIDAVAIFGKKDDYRYFLTDVFMEVPPAQGIPFPPAISFYGFGGGIYKRMQQSASNSAETDFGKSLSGINYVPDKDVGMGFMASTKFGTIGSAALFNAKLTFEMQFNKTGGVNFIQLRGDGAFMNDPNMWGDLADNINKTVKKIEDKGGRIKLSAKSDLKVPENKKSGFLTASMNIKYDLANSVFSADLATYLNAGFIKGVGQNDKMGWASAYFSREKWYTYIGTPSDRLGVEILGLARADGYFMVGDDIPELPPPPPEVLQNFSARKRAQFEGREGDNLASGSGLAFGQSIGVKFNATLTPFYARFGVGLGAEFLLKNYGANAYCAGSSKTLGINGWYARAQAWAWVEAGIGIEAKLFGSSRRFEILDLSASALLAGAGPNPFYFTGAVGGRFSVMGGLVSGNCNFDFEIGKECKVMGGSPFGEEVISQLTPTAGEKEVNVFAAPQAVFNIPVGLEMEVEEAEGEFAWYKVTLEEFSVKYKDSGQAVEGYEELSEDGKIFLFDPEDPFESSKKMIAYAKVGFMRKLNGVWQLVKGSDGKPLYEFKQAEFTSGDRPKSILPEHVVSSYPLSRQYNYYPNEYENGYVMVSENYDYLFTTDKPVGYNQVLKVTDTKGQEQTMPFSYKKHSAGNNIRFEINYNSSSINFSNDEIYELALSNVPQKEAGIMDNISTDSVKLAGYSDINTDSVKFIDTSDLHVKKHNAESTLNVLEEKKIYNIHFRTSMYNTFDDKMAVMKLGTTMTWPECPGVDRVVANIYEDGATDESEVLDGFESRTLEREKNLVQFKPVYENNRWYKNKIAPLMYENQDLLTALNKTSMSPTEDSDVIYLTMFSEEHTLTDEMIEGIDEYILSMGSLNYRVPYYVENDFMDLQTEISNTIPSGNRSKGVAKFLNTDQPSSVINGKYEVEASYHLPGKDIITSTVKMEVNLKE